MQMTNLLITNNESLLEISNIIVKFEKATGLKLNRNKTKIYGTGYWKNKEQWPLDWIKVEERYFYTLGIYYCNDYNDCIEKNWSVIMSKIQQHANMLLNRRLTLQQRAAYANSCMLSKMGYVAHIYPLTTYFAKQINKIIFRYIWGGRYEPIK